VKPKLASDPHFCLTDEQGHADTVLRDAGMIYSDIVKGVDAWTVANRTGLVAAAYKLGYCDGHIQTYLQLVFPNAVFQEKPRY
jgi:hypothetical protein